MRHFNRDWTLAMRRLLLFLFAFVLLADAAQAQIQVGMRIKRRLHVLYEPVIATVAIRNLSGRDLPLADEGGIPWFGFEITREGGQVIPPLVADYKLEPLIIPAGQTFERTVNLNALYGLHNYGMYRIRATIYFSPLKQYFQSPMLNVEMSDGKVLWKQEVGVPEGQPGAGGRRRYTVLTFRQPTANYLYIRIEDVDTGGIFACFPVGRILSGMEPAVKLDLANTLNVLQVTGPKTYLHTQVGLDGQVLAQDLYTAEKTRPGLRLNRSGSVAVVGGQLAPANASQDQGGRNAAASGVPKLSDRPVVLPRN